MIHSFKPLYFLAATAFLAVSCTDYSPYEGSTTDLEYAKNFKEKFGKIDPEQDWSMAQQITANVTVGGSDSYVAIYTDKPLYADTKILDAFKGTNHTFDALENTQQVYAIVRNEGKTLVAGYFDVEDGKLNISANPVAKKTAATRAFTNGSGVTKAYVEDDVINVRDTELKYVSGGMYKTLEEWREWATAKAAAGELSINNYAPFSADCVIPAGTDWSNPTLDLTKCIVATTYGAVYNGQFHTLEEAIADKKANFNAHYNFPFTNDHLYDPSNPGSCTADNSDWSKAKFDESQVTVANAGDILYWPAGASGYQVFSLASLIDFVQARGTSDYTPFVESSIVKPAHLDFTHATLASDVPQGYDPNAWMIDLTYLGNVETEAAQPWTLSLGYQLFGPKSFFMEQNYYFGPKSAGQHDKRDMYGSTDAEKLETLKKIEAGFSITTKQDAEIEVPFIYGATIISDQFGYVYYKDGQDPLKQPHYILMKNGKPTTNI